MSNRKIIQREGRALFSRLLILIILASGPVIYGCGMVGDGEISLEGLEECLLDVDGVIPRRDPDTGGCMRDPDTDEFVYEIISGNGVKNSFTAAEDLIDPTGGKKTEVDTATALYKAVVEDDRYADAVQRDQARIGVAVCDLLKINEAISRRLMPLIDMAGLLLGGLSSPPRRVQGDLIRSLLKNLVGPISDATEEMAAYLGGIQDENIKAAELEITRDVVMAFDISGIIGLIKGFVDDAAAEQGITIDWDRVPGRIEIPLKGRYGEVEIRALGIMSNLISGVLDILLAHSLNLNLQGAIGLISASFEFDTPNKVLSLMDSVAGLFAPPKTTNTPPMLGFGTGDDSGAERFIRSRYKFSELLRFLMGAEEEAGQENEEGDEEGGGLRLIEALMERGSGGDYIITFEDMDGDESLSNGDVLNLSLIPSWDLTGYISGENADEFIDQYGMFLKLSPEITLPIELGPISITGDMITQLTGLMEPLLRKVKSGLDGAECVMDEEGACVTDEEGKIEYRCNVEDRITLLKDLEPLVNFFLGVFAEGLGGLEGMISGFLVPIMQIDLCELYTEPVPIRGMLPAMIEIPRESFTDVGYIFAFEGEIARLICEKECERDENEECKVDEEGNIILMDDCKMDDEGENIYINDDERLKIGHSTHFDDTPYFIKADKITYQEGGLLDVIGFLPYIGWEDPSFSRTIWINGQLPRAAESTESAMSAIMSLSGDNFIPLDNFSINAFIGYIIGLVAEIEPMLGGLM